MAQKAMPAWVNKLASAASWTDKQAFVELGEDVTNLPVMKAALERDPAWALAKGDDVSWDVVTEFVTSQFIL